MAIQSNYSKSELLHIFLFDSKIFLRKYGFMILFCVLIIGSGIFAFHYYRAYSEIVRIQTEQQNQAIRKKELKEWYNFRNATQYKKELPK